MTFLTMLMGLLILISLNAAYGEEKNPETGCDDITTLLQKQNGQLSADLKRIQREIAALRSEMAQPDLKDVFSGIGYILGLFGVAAYVASRRKPPRT